MSALIQRFVRLPEDDAVVWHGLLWCTALYLFHYAMWSPWFIEDAAITFAYAHNFASGEGLVSYPGGELVEGFSNPSWTLMLAALDLVGIDPFMGSKLLGALFGVLTLPLAYSWLARIRPDQPRWALAAPFALALSPQFVVWNASGLENSVFNLFLAAGAVQLLRETEEDGVPISALAWFVFAITRPEAPLYAAVSGCAGTALVTYRRGWRAAFTWSWQWLVLFLTPFLAWHAWRYYTFAWEFPNTYYAKLGEGKRFRPLTWNKYGWGYLRSYALSSGQGFALPIYALGQTGLPGNRGTIGILMCMGALALVIPGVDMGLGLQDGTEDANFVLARVAYLAALVVLLPLVGLGRQGQIERGYAWVLAAIALFFALYSGGDWMRGWRWLAMPSVPMAVLLGDGAAELGAGIALPRRLERFVAPLIVAVLGAVSIGNSVWIGSKAETMPYDVGRRVQHMQMAQRKLAIDHVALLEVDMGAHMWWSGFEVVDIAGLVDVPMGHQHFDGRFLDTYVFEWRNPEFAHVHGHWAKRSRLNRRPGFSNYLEIPGYASSRGARHVGNHVRKDLFIAKRWSGTPGREVLFTEASGARATRTAFRLLGWEVPAPEVPPGGDFYLEVGLQRPGPKQTGRLIAFFSNASGVVWSGDVPPGYDWYRPEEWRLGEVVTTRAHLPLPANLPTGTYDLGFVMMGEGPSAEVFTARNGAEQPVLAAGEVRFPNVVTVVSPSEALALANTKLAAVQSHAEAGECDEAHAAWASARRHLAQDHPWQAEARATADHARAGCIARSIDPNAIPEAVEQIRFARRLDHNNADVIAVGKDLADAWERRGDAAAATDDPEVAITWWERALGADPTRSWVRRRTELTRTEWLEARHHRPKK